MPTKKKVCPYHDVIIKIDMAEDYANIFSSHENDLQISFKLLFSHNIVTANKDIEFGPTCKWNTNDSWKVTYSI